MNIFQKSAAGFRRGTALDDDLAPLQPSTAGAALLGAEDATNTTQHDFASWTAAAASHITSLPDLLRSAQNLPAASLSEANGFSVEKDSTRQRCLFPSTPYYGILSRCEVQLDIAIETDTRRQATGGAAADTPAAQYNPPSCVRRLASMQRLLSRTAERHGALYFLGTGGAATPQDALVSSASPSTSAAASTTSAGTAVALSYGTYVEAMLDGLRRMSAVRAACVSPASPRQLSSSASSSPPFRQSHHCFYLRLLNHPTWRDLGALLCVENGRLLLCLVASSRVTQKHISAECAAVGVAAEWVSGAALLVEPTALPPTAVNPVCAAWEVLLHLPLLPHSVPNGETQEESAEAAARGVGGSRDGTGDRTALAAVRDALAVLRSASAELRGFHLSLVSSLPFHGARRCCPTGRFAEESLIYSTTAAATATAVFPARAEPQLSLSSATHSSSATPGSSRSRWPVARRFVWRLLPTQGWVLPHFLPQLLRCLIEECGLDSFTLRCAAASDTAALAAGSPSASLSATIAAPTSTSTGGGAGANGNSGVRVVRGEAPGLLSVQRGPSSASLLAFSRLSSAAWVDAATREALGVQPEEEEDGEEVEMEFELTSLHYQRGGAVSSLKRPHTATGLCEGEEEEEGGAEGCGDVPLSEVHTEAWGAAFRLGVVVKRLITVDDDDAE